MSDGEKPAGMGAGKIVLIVVLVLFVLGALCCGGAWFFGGRYAWQFGRASVALAQDVQTNCGANATMNFFPDDEGRMVLALGVTGDLTPERIREIQDATWKSYATCFAEGGFELHAVAVGSPGKGKGGVKGWKENSALVTDLIARTGVAAPPKAEWIEKIEAEQRAAAEKEAASDGEDPADAGPGGRDEVTVPEPARSSTTSTPAAADPLARLRIDRGPQASSRRRGSKGWIVLVLLVLGGGGAALFAMREQLGAPAVRTGKARRITATEGAVRTTASGYVVARTRAAISSKMSGRLEKILVDVGHRVKAGDVLGELGHTDLDASVAQAEADIEVRRRNIATAEAQRAAAAAALAAQGTRVAEMEAAVREMETRLTDSERIVVQQEKLATSGAGIRDALDTARMQRAVMTEQLARAKTNVASSKADVARAEADLAASDAAVNGAEAGLLVARAALDHAQAVRQDAFIVAPFDGVVVRKEAEVGEMVSPVNAAGSTTRGAIVTLVDFTSLEMVVDVIERDIAKIEDGAPCRIVLDARRDHPYAGVVRQKVPTADRSTSTVQVKISFKTLDAFVLPEMGGRVEFLDPARADAALAKDRVLAPAEAFTEHEGKSGVWTLRDGRTEWLAARRAVDPKSPDGGASSGEVEVAEGLAGGEDVLLSPPAGLAPGALVRAAK